MKAAVVCDFSDSLRLFTSESVTEGHPDKICDQISDSILDALLAEDPQRARRRRDAGHDRPRPRRRRGHDLGYVDIPGIVRQRITDIGYDSSDVWFDGRSCGVSISIGAQSPDIAQGVDDAFESREGSTTILSTIRAPATRASCSATRPARPPS